MSLFHEKVDEHLKLRIVTNGCNQWYNMSLDLISFSFVAFLIVFTILFKDKFSAAAVAIIYTYCDKMKMSLIHGLRTLTFYENSMIGYERCMEYTKCPSEAPTKNVADSKLNNWPDKGKIEFINFSVKYRPDTEIVLKNINFLIQGKEKIGIVGRTGSGKSSLTLSLFRIVEAFKGKIEIDGQNIADIPLKKLRRAISIVPQEPFLLEGTLKTNLDPLNIYTEEEINDVLEKVQLYQMLEHDNVKGKNVLKGINTEIKEYGNNLSFGCRQLLCVARAILRKSKVIILDEATSSVDQKTEDIISNAVDVMFKDSTVITIAHRINTVKKCQKIIVMNAGEVVEVGNPDDLIKDTKSQFYSLYYKYIEETD